MTCEQGSICFELAKGLPAAFVALVIGAIAAGIAWRQYRVAQAKLKLDLFEKRLVIFQKTWTFMSIVVERGPADHPRTDFTNIIPEAGFLFGSGIQTYLQLVASNHTELWALRGKMSQPYKQASQAEVDRHTVLTEWFLEQASAGVKNAFWPYLDFSKWK